MGIFLIPLTFTTLQPMIPHFLRRLRRCLLHVDPLQQRLRTVLPADQLRVVLTPLLGEFDPESFGQDGLGEVVDAGLGRVDLLFDSVRAGGELSYKVDRPEALIGDANSKTQAKTQENTLPNEAIKGVNSLRLMSR